MATARNHPRILLAASLLGLVYVFVSGGSPRAAKVEEPEGRAERLLPTNRPTVEAAFPRESYSPGNLARLVFWTGAPRCPCRIFRAGTEDSPVRAQDVMLGTAVTATRRLGAVGPGRTIRIRIGEWPSGLYFAKLVARGGKVGYAPFVLRPRTLGESHVAVVLSTMTWQAYNFHDDDRNGTLDTWYAGQPHARLGRPYENRGAIPHYKHYEQPFLRWLVSTNRDVDYLADADLDAPSTTGRGLAEAYDLIVFPGHHEYVTRPRVRRRDRLPEPRRQPHVPVRQQLLLPNGQAGQCHDPHRSLATRRPPRGRAHRRPVLRQRCRAASGSVDASGQFGEEHGSSPARTCSPVRALPGAASRPMRPLRARRAELR